VTDQDRRRPRLPKHTGAAWLKRRAAVERAVSASDIPGRLAAGFVVGTVEGGTGTLKGAGDEVAVDLVRDLDALVAEPARHLGDRDALGQCSGGIEVAQ